MELQTRHLHLGIVTAWIGLAIVAVVLITHPPTFAGSVGVMGDERTYENVLGLRAVNSTDGMTADWFPFPHDILGRISNRIINEVTGVNRVGYDISSKPPSTIEWE